MVERSVNGNGPVKVIDSWQDNGAPYDLVEDKDGVNHVMRGTKALDARDSIHILSRRVEMQKRAISNSHSLLDGYRSKLGTFKKALADILGD